MEKDGVARKAYAKIEGGPGEEQRSEAIVIGRKLDQKNARTKQTKGEEKIKRDNARQNWSVEREAIGEKLPQKGVAES